MKTTILTIAAGMGWALAAWTVSPCSCRAAENASRSSLLFDRQAQIKTVLLPPSTQARVLSPVLRESRESSLESFATKISVAGALLLTADRVVRSMDSVMETMQVRRPDGTCLRLDMESPKGLGMMLKLSRPFDF